MCFAGTILVLGAVFVAPWNPWVGAPSLSELPFGSATPEYFQKVKVEESWQLAAKVGFGLMTISVFGMILTFRSRTKKVDQ